MIWHMILQASLRSEEEKAVRQEAELTQLRDQLYRAHRKTSRSSLDTVAPALSRTLRSRQQVGFHYAGNACAVAACLEPLAAQHTTCQHQLLA